MPREAVILNTSVYRWGHRSSKRASGLSGVIQLGRIKCRPELKVFDVPSLSMFVFLSPLFHPKAPSLPISLSRELKGTPSMS